MNETKYIKKSWCAFPSVKWITLLALGINLKKKEMKKKWSENKKNKNPIAIFVKPLINFVQKQTNTKENIEEEKSKKIIYPVKIQFN